MRIKNAGACGLLLVLSGMAGAQCVNTPTRAFNGLVPIVYPEHNGGSAFLERACDAGARRLADDVRARAGARGVFVKWVEVYGARRWGSTFHDLIYRTRALGYSQAGFTKYNVVPRSTLSGGEFLVYANRSGKYIAMASYKEGVDTANTTDVFIVYGN